MDTGQALSLLMVAVMCLFLLAGFPVAFTLSGTALIFAAGGFLAGAFDPSFLGAIPQRIFGLMTNQVLIAIPLFIFMGVMLQRSKVADDLLESVGRLFGRLRGGLGIAIVLVGALLAASTGIVGATVMTMGLLSLPTMLRWSYDPALASGVIVASGTLGQIIPPSIILVLLADVISAAFQRVQLEQQIFSPEVVSVTDLFAGAMVPGLLLVALFVSFLALIAWLVPTSAPAMQAHDPGSAVSQPKLFELLRVIFPPLALILAVLGSILAGIATPTESAAVGAVGTLLLAGLRTDGRRAWPIAAAVVA
ncbi:MAG: TRAP transporter large permease, partial [Geminicoccales bacterium]